MDEGIDDTFVQWIRVTRSALIRCVGQGESESERSEHMSQVKHVAIATVLLVAAMVVTRSTAVAQGTTRTCRPARVIPLTENEPAAKLNVDAPLAEPLASRGVVVIPYCAENMHIAPVFGPGALTVSPRVGHIHVTVDDLPWRWADASGNPLILQALPPGRHKVLIELVDANHQPVDRSTITFDVPTRAAQGASTPTLEAQRPTLTELLSRDLAGMPGREITMITVEYPPGGSDPVHRHHAQVMVYVLEGSIVMQAKDKPSVTLGAGQTFYEDPDDVHVVARNASNTARAKFLVFLRGRAPDDAAKEATLRIESAVQPGDPSAPVTADTNV